ICALRAHPTEFDPQPVPYVQPFREGNLMPATPETAPRAVTPAPMGVNLLLGTATDFFDTLGIGSFATTTAVLRLGRLVEDENIPGTLNVGHAIPTILEAALFISAVPVEIVTLITMVLAGGIGAWFGTGIVVHWPRRAIQRGMAIALVITAGFMVLRMLTSLSLSEGTVGLSGLALMLAIVASLVIGSLTSLGIGNYAPTMAVTYMLGMNQKSVFPIMAASASLILPAAAVRFYRAGRFDKRTAIGLAIGGVPGVLIAVYVVKTLPLEVVRWIVVGVLLYTSATLWMSSRNAASVA
ncbi:MAG TPA: sulfite exporter TauE/SafE family protein, partial [Gemmatimonadales bacterium]